MLAPVRPGPPARPPAAARSLPPPANTSACQIKRRARPAGWSARPWVDMAALYACTKCHQRFPFEALSQGQQLCKVRGLGRRPGTRALEARPAAPGPVGTPLGFLVAGRGRAAWHRGGTEPVEGSRGTWAVPGRSGPRCRRVRVLSNREIALGPGRWREGRRAPGWFSISCALDCARAGFRSPGVACLPIPASPPPKSSWVQGAASGTRAVGALGLSGR